MKCGKPENHQQYNPPVNSLSNAAKWMSSSHNVPPLMARLAKKSLYSLLPVYQYTVHRFAYYVVDLRVLSIVEVKHEEED